jgi:hypothetical protein
MILNGEVEIIEELSTITLDCLGDIAVRIKTQAQLTLWGLSMYSVILKSAVNKGVRMDRSEWRAAYRPKLDYAGYLRVHDVVNDIDFIEKLDPSKVWSEIWDFDSERL